MMQAAVFHGGKDIRVERLPVPSPGPGEVLVRVAAAGICGSDLHRYRGDDPWQSAGAGPRRAGHELAGTVVALGPEVRGVEVGQRVGVEPTQLAGCGLCRPCRQGSYHICARRGKQGRSRRISAGFSEFDLALAANLFPLPDDLPFDLASMADVYACAVHAVRRAAVDAVEAVVVVGSGPVGLAIGQVARASGARRVILVGRRQAPLDLARRAGAADEVIDAGHCQGGQGRQGGQGVGEEVRRLLGGEGAELVFETVGGGGSTIRDAVEAVGPGGTVVILGAFVGAVAVPYPAANEKELVLRWSNGYSTWRGEREYRLALALLAGRRIDAAPLVTHRFPLARIAEAFAAADDKRASGALKVVVEPG
jgi:threonine dehydrogenase-like Zn-dependent dehydrogenase